MENGKQFKPKGVKLREKNSIRSDKEKFLSTCFCVKILFSHVFLLYLSHSLGGR